MLIFPVTVLDLALADLVGELAGASGAERIIGGGAVRAGWHACRQRLRLRPLTVLVMLPPAVSGHAVWLVDCQHCGYQQHQQGERSV